MRLAVCHYLWYLSVRRQSSLTALVRLPEMSATGSALVSFPPVFLLGCQVGECFCWGSVLRKEVRLLVGLRGGGGGRWLFLGDVRGRDMGWAWGGAKQ